MRLVCPNCEAKYEVPDDAIPDTGRDVQCANCGHAWFQMRARAATVASVVAPVVAPPVAPPVAPVVAAEASAPSAPVIEAQGGDGGADGQGAPAEGPVPVQDERVLTILREEAEREAKARREKTRLLDAPRDPEEEPRKKAAAKKKDPVSVAEPKPAAVPEPAPPPRPAPAPQPMPEIEPEIELKVVARRDLLPDVEEIKSTLQQSETEEPEFASGYHGDGDGRERSGAFRSGFLTVITIAILGASIYNSSPWLSAKVPALSGPLTAYVAGVDGLRLQLDGLMRAATLLIAGQKG